MTFNSSIDLGQVILGFLVALVGLLVAVVGWFVKKTISEFAVRLDKHDSILMGLVSDVATLIGYTQGLKIKKRPANVD